MSMLKMPFRIYYWLQILFILMKVAIPQCRNQDTALKNLQVYTFVANNQKWQCFIVQILLIYNILLC